MSLLSIRDLHFLDLNNGAFENKLPEFYGLKNCVEHMPPWHFYESVFDHSISVVGSLLEIFNRENKQLRTYLGKNPFDHYTKKDLLFLMTAFHDIAKPDTVITDENGYTSCPEHERKGAIKAQSILDRFDLVREESECITAMIGLHGIFCYTQHRENPERDYNNLRRLHPSIYLDMLLFELADTKALHVADEGRILQQEMVDFYERKIGECLKS